MYSSEQGGRSFMEQPRGRGRSALLFTSGPGDVHEKEVHPPVSFQSHLHWKPRVFKLTDHRVRDPWSEVGGTTKNGSRQRSGRLWERGHLQHRDRQPAEQRWRRKRFAGRSPRRRCLAGQALAGAQSGFKHEFGARVRTPPRSLLGPDVGDVGLFPLGRRSSNGTEA